MARRKLQTISTLRDSSISPNTDILPAGGYVVTEGNLIRVGVSFDRVTQLGFRVKSNSSVFSKLNSSQGEQELNGYYVYEIPVAAGDTFQLQIFDDDNTSGIILILNVELFLDY